METTPERVFVSDGTVVEVLTGQMEHHMKCTLFRPDTGISRRT